MKPEELKTTRKELGLTQAQFANLVGVADGRTVRRWEDGSREIPGTVIILLSVIDNCSDARKFLGL